MGLMGTQPQLMGWVGAGSREVVCGLGLGFVQCFAGFRGLCASVNELKQFMAITKTLL
jgi:hypothetical protein